MENEIGHNLRIAYNRAAEQRDRQTIAPWKRDERLAFLDLLNCEGKTNLLEVGSGPGSDSLFFQQNGMHVISTDLSPEMVRLCRQKGLIASEMDLLQLAFGDSQFDAVYALNCFLHVPRPKLGDALQEIRRVLKPGGLFFLAIYGGVEKDGPWETDTYVPKRHFSLYTDDRLEKIVCAHFELRNFKIIEVPSSSQPEIHMQRFILRKAGDVSAQLGL